jgi:hypothetical protein
MSASNGVACNSIDFPVNFVHKQIQESSFFFEKKISRKVLDLRTLSNLSELSPCLNLIKLITITVLFFIVRDYHHHRSPPV